MFNETIKDEFLTQFFNELDMHASGLVERLYNKRISRLRNALAMASPVSDAPAQPTQAQIDMTRESCVRAVANILASRIVTAVLYGRKLGDINQTMESIN